MKYIKGFDGLRAISILLVLLTHLGLYKHIEKYTFLKNNFALISGTTGVKVFFVISGFLITTLLLIEQRDKGQVHFRKFFLRRILRLLPPLLVFCTIVLCFMLFRFISPNYVALVLAFFYCYNFVPHALYLTELGHTWSLAVEEQFYLLWPLCLHFMQTRRNKFLLSLLLIFLCLLAEVLLHLPYEIKGMVYNLSDQYYVDRFFLPACLPIIIGSLTALILFYYTTAIEVHFRNKAWLLVVSILFFGSHIFLPSSLWLLELLLQPIGISLFTIYIYFNPQAQLTKLLEWTPLAYMGKLSYGIYIYQGLFLRTGPGGNLWIQQFPQNLILVFGTALLSYYLIEKPIIKWKKKIQ
jgi:peptidoglycan/LPS O-acetylase OafA/YrhL